MTLPGFFSPAQASTSVGNANIAIPQTDPRDGDLQIALIAARPSSITLATPSGWTLQGSLTATDSLGEAVDQGSVVQYVFTRECDGTEGTATQTFVKTGTASVINGTMMQVRSATGTYDIGFTQRAESGDVTAFGGTETDIGFEPDDLVVMMASQNGDLANTSAWAMAQSGLTFTTGVEHAEHASTTGNDQENDIATTSVTSGTGSGNVTSTVTMSAAVSGVLGIMRIRQGAGTARSDVWVRAAGAQVAATTTCVISYPENRVGDMVVAAINSRTDTNTPTTPANWTLLGSWTGGQGVFGADAGNARTTIFYREVSSVLTGTQSFSITSGSTGVGQMFVIAKDDAKSWEAPVGTGVGIAKEDPWSEALTDSIEFTDDAVVVSFFSCNTDAMTGVQTPTISAAGVTFGDTTITSYWETTTGNDSAFAAHTSRVTTGATATPTVGLDWIGTAPTNGPAGSIGMIVLNQAVPLAPVSFGFLLTRQAVNRSAVI